MKLKKLIGILAVAGLAAPGIASATNGYFAHGYGMKAKGMGGAATATANDAMGGANNPASMVWVGDRLDVGVDVFSPIRSAERTGSNGNANNFSQKSDSNYFFIPEFGYNKMMSSDMSLGVTVYGNGGMNTNYPGNTTSVLNCTGGGSAANTLNALCGTGKLGVNLEQLIIAPAWAMKINSTNSIGVAPLFGYQKFRAEGLGAFAGLSADSTKLSNNGDDTSTGWGIRLGWQGKVSDAVTLGANYTSKMTMSKFDKYKGLFAEQGKFDIPENYGLGIAFKANPEVTVALDYERINYAGVRSVSNSGTVVPGVACPADPACMGNNAGEGFAWRSIDVFKLGVEYKYSSTMTLRAGYNHGDNPIPSGQQTFNIVAPGVVEDHVTLGMTYAVSPGSEVTVAYMHAFEKSVSGATNPNFAVGGAEKIKMYQDSLGVTYGMKF
jgi:long-chain fatty acid transport protein